MKSSFLFADILIADPDEAVVRVVRRTLQAAGYIARAVSSGAATLEAVRTKPPDLIVLAACLPDMNGYQVARALRDNEAFAFIPIIMMASQETRPDLSQALNAGANEFISKPIDNIIFLNRIRAMLRLKATTDALSELNATLEEKVIERTRELEEANARLRHAEKLSALGRLAASIAHEINNPLTSILTYLYLIKEDIKADTSLKEYFGHLERQINAIAKLVQRLRNYAKPPRQERHQVFLNEVVDEVLVLVGKELEHRGISVKKSCEPDLPPIMASADQVGEVVMNLVLNAQDAMNEGDELSLHTQVNGEWVEMRVRDTGEGVPPELLDRIFEPFFTTKGEKGTGLGLAICQSIVTEHHGEILVESQVGEGTEFIVRLPKASSVNGVLVVDM